MQPAPEEEGARRRWTIVFLMVAMSLMSYFDRTIIAVAAPTIMKEFSLDARQMGLLSTAFQLGYALLMIPGGFLADRYGPRAVLTVMGLGAALFTGLTAGAGSPVLGMWGVVPAFVLMRACQGVFTAPIYPACARVTATQVPEQGRNLVQGLIAAGAGLGGALPPLLFTWMIREHGWRKGFVAAGVATGLVALVWFWCFRERPGGHSAPEETGTRAVSWRRLLTNRSLLLLTASYFAVGYFDYVLFYWTYYYLQEVRHYTQEATAMYTTWIWLAWTAMSPLGGWITDRLVRRHGARRGLWIVPVSSLILGGLFLIAAVHREEPLAVVACLALALGCAGAADGPYWVAAIRVGGKDAATAGSIMNTGANLGGIAPWITGIVASHAEHAGRDGWAWALYLAVLVLGLGLIPWIFINPSEEDKVISQGSSP